MSQEEYRNEGRRPAQSRSGHGGRRVAPSHPEGCLLYTSDAADEL